MAARLLRPVFVALASCLAVAEVPPAPASSFALVVIDSPRREALWALGYSK